MNEDMDWIDEGKCEAPADHDEALRAMTEMRESIRNLYIGHNSRTASSAARKS